MTAIQPPLFIGVNGEIGADELGLPFRDLIGEGIVAAGDLLVAQRAAGANMSVDVAAGAAWVKGDDDANAQPTYRVRNDATVNVAVPGADATNPRIDRIVARVYDSAFAGTSLTWDVELVEGAPTAGATLVNLTGAAAVPHTALLLANVLVPAAASSIVTADISDQRVTAKVGAGALPLNVSTGAGTEVGYDAITAPVNITGTTSGAPTAVIAGSAHMFDGAAVMADFFAPQALAPQAASGTMNVGLFEGSALIAVLVQVVGSSPPQGDLVGKLRFAPSAGSHTYSIKAWVNGTNGTPAIDAGTGTGGALAPAFLRFTKV